MEKVTVICCFTAELYDRVLANGVRAIGVGFQGKIQMKNLLRLIGQQKPTHLVLRTQIREIFQGVIRHKVKTIATLADSFSTQGFLRNKIKNYWLASLLNKNQIEWIGNRGINSCLSLQKMGVKPSKIIPGD